MLTRTLLAASSIARPFEKEAIAPLVAVYVGALPCEGTMQKNGNRTCSYEYLFVFMCLCVWCVCECVCVRCRGRVKADEI